MHMYENHLVMIFLNHQCYCHLGIPRIVSAKYEVILSLATMFYLSEKSHREGEGEGEREGRKKPKKQQFQIDFRAVAQKPNEWYIYLRNKNNHVKKDLTENSPLFRCKIALAGLCQLDLCTNSLSFPWPAQMP